MFAIALRHDEHTRKYRVSTSERFGWDLTLTEDFTPTRQVHFEDWHRVERALQSLQLEVLELTANGWKVENAA